MNVTMEDVSPVEKKLAFEIEWPLVAVKLEEAYRELGRGVTLKGFRKGKVPRNIVEKMFSRQVEQDVVQKLIQETFLRAVQQHSLEPVTTPIVDDVELKKGEGLRYSARVEVRAPIDPKDYDGVELQQPAPSVSDEEMERALEYKRNELTQYRKIEGRVTLAANDVVSVDVKGELGGKLIAREEVLVTVGGSDREVFPGLGKALIGAPVGARDHEVVIDLPPPSGSVAPEAGHGSVTARLKITVKEAREKLVPALDDDFAKDTGEADTLAELRTKLRAGIVLQKERDGQRELRSLLVKELVRRNSFEVPASLVEQQATSMAQRLRVMMMMNGVDSKNLSFDDTKLKESLRGEAADEVRGVMLIDAIATKEKVLVTDADIEKRLAEMAKDREKSVARLKAELQKDGRFEQMKHQLREEKTLDLLLTRAKITAAPGAFSVGETRLDSR